MVMNFIVIMDNLCIYIDFFRGSIESCGKRFLDATGRHFGDLFEIYKTRHVASRALLSFIESLHETIRSKSPT